MNLKQEMSTEKWAKYREFELIVQKRILKAFPGVQIIETDKDKAASIDIILARKNSITGIGEIKCRDYNYARLRELGNTVLVTCEKLEKAATIAKILKTPFFLFVYLVPEDVIHYWKICDEDGKGLFPFETKEFETPKTINGGRVTRLNALIDFKYQSGVL